MQITFSDIAIQSQYSEIESRSLVDLTSKMAGNKLALKLPIISSNMPDITEWKMATEMAIHGGIGIIHRFMEVEENCLQFEKAVREISAKNNGTFESNVYNVGVSIGVSEDEQNRFSQLYEKGARIFCIDVAHGHHKNMKKTLEWITSNFDASNLILIAGNVANGDGAVDLCNWGADIIKTGIGPGGVCRTRSNTGVGVPQFSALMDCYMALVENRLNGNHSLIADGGITTTGDIAKALIYADAIMVGGVLAGTSETPGNVYPVAGTNLTNRQYYKVYGGSASGENKAKGQRGLKIEFPRFVEGEMKTVPFKGHAKYILREIADGLKSSFSYSNASNVQEFKSNVKWEIISSGGSKESKY